MDYIPGTHGINLFADDALICIVDGDLASAQERINESLKYVEPYLNISKLKLNVSKTKPMIITTKAKHRNINIDSIKIFKLKIVRSELKVK